MIKRGTAKFYFYCLSLLSILALLASMTVIVLQGVWDFIGFNQSNRIPMDPTCTNIYVLTKFQTIAVNKQLGLTLIVICIAFVLTAIVLGVLIMLVCSLFLSKEQQEDQYLPIITPTKVYILYILTSWDLLCIGIHFGYFLSFFVQISTSCNSSIGLNTQLIVMFCLSGFMLLMMIIVWIGILVMNADVKRYKSDNQVIHSPLVAKDRQSKHNREIQMKDYVQQEKEQMASARKSLLDRDRQSSPSYNYSPKKQTVNEYLDPGRLYIASQLHDRRKKNQKSILHQINQKSNQDSNTHQRSDIYYGNHRQIQHRPSPKNQPSSNLVYHRPRYQSPQSIPKTSQINQYRKRQEQNAYDRRNSNKKLQSSYFRESAHRNRNYVEPVQNLQQSRRKLQHQYEIKNRFEDRHTPPRRVYQEPRQTNPHNNKNLYSEGKHDPQDSRNRNDLDRKSPNSNSKGTPDRQRKGMLIDYIRGRYVQ